MRVIVILALSLHAAEARKWANKEGNSFEGELVSANKTEVEIIRDTDRKKFTIERSTLSDSDNKHIDEHLASVELEELMQTIPRTFREALKKTKDSRKRTIILYAPDFDRRKLDRLINQILSNKQLMNRLKGKANLAILINRERKMEEETPWPARENAINLFLYTDLYEDISFSFGEDLDGYEFSPAFEELIKPLC